MNNKKCVFLLLLLLISCFPLAASETPPNQNEMVIGIVHDLPVGMNLDPSLCCDVTSLELIYNVYENLISYDREKLNQFVPRLATNWTVSSDGLTYTFRIRGTDGAEDPVKFHNGQFLTTEDVEYSFERILVQEMAGAYLLNQALFGVTNLQNESGEFVVTGQNIDDAITHDETTVTFNLEKPFPPFVSLLALPWTFTITSKQWCLDNGFWPGTWENWQTYHQQRAVWPDPGDAAAPGPHIDVMCGTGPYFLEYFDNELEEWSICKFDDYWRGWPASGCRGLVERAKVTWHHDWPEMKDMFLAGQLDSIKAIVIPVENLAEVLGQPGVRSVFPLPTIYCTAMFFNFDIEESSPFMGVAGGLPPGTLNETGIPPDFFSDVNVRKGFAYAFNYTEYINEVFQGQASQPATMIVPGMPFYNPDQEMHTTNLTRAEEHFRSAWNGDLWDEGFNFTLCYYEGSIDMEQAWQIIKTSIESINPRFHITIEGPIARTLYIEHRKSRRLPLFRLGWVPDYPDPHIMAFYFMHHLSGTSQCQSYRDDAVSALIEAGIAETDPEQRRQIYYDLQIIYYEQCPSVPLYQPWERRLEREWVQGWFYNPMYGSGFDDNYFYSQWKELVPPAEVTAGNNVVDFIEAYDTVVSINTTGSGSVSASKHDINIGGPFPGDVVNTKCVIIDTTLTPDEIVFPLEIRIYYTTEEIVSAYIDQSTLRMYYWNETTGKWIVEPNSGWVEPSDIPGYTGYVWALIDHLSLFTAMGKRNVAPNVKPIQAPLDPVKINTIVTVSAAFTDFMLDTHTATWTWGDGSTSPAIVDETGGCGTVSGSHVYEIPGVYSVRLDVTDDDGNLASVKFEYIVVYDPEGGFVTGGGWINSPEGAFSDDRSLTGKANFGFVSKYLKSAVTPSGQTQFVFKVADLNFHSSMYDWLVVAGARAQYKGSGTINGNGDYGFILTAIDGQISGGGGVDKFRIKIWDKATDTIVYDNLLGAIDSADPTTVISEGSIVIHKTK